MDIININCKLNNDDNFAPSNQFLEVNIFNKKHYHFNFWDYKINKNILNLPSFFQNESLDLLYIALFVFYADRRIKREMFLDAWTRKFKLFIPVLELDKWNKEKKLLENILSFLSGDNWKIEFRKRNLNETETRFQNKKIKGNNNILDFDKFCMLSGGLDSYIGALDLLEESKKIAFVGHYGGGASGKKYQDNVIHSIQKEHNLSDDNFFNFYAAPLKGIENTTRSRSFMFFTHAIILASSMRKQIDLIIPENGLISLNVPLTNSRLGSSSTRTTHPYYMSMLQSLINNLGLKIKLINPYQFKTKGEMIIECKNDTLLKENINKTMSCSHPDQGRYKFGGNTGEHCGICLPCIIRRAAIKKSTIIDKSIYRDINFKSGPNAVHNFNVYKLGIEKYRRKREMSIFEIQTSGPLYKNLKEFKSLYDRGMKELIEFLDTF